MADINNTVNEQGTGTGTDNQENNQPKTFTQDEVNKMISERVAREKAKYADYEQIKEKAGKYDQTVESSKTDLQKATERADAAEKELEAYKKAESARTIRAKVAAEMGVPAEALTGEDEDTCKAQAKAMLDYFKPNAYPNVKDGGENNKTGKRTTADEFSDWFKKAL